MSDKKIVLSGYIDNQPAEIAFEHGQADGQPAPPEAVMTMTVDGKTSRITFNEDVALTVTAGNQKRHITFKELTLSNNLALESLVKLLVDKKMIEIKDLQETMDVLRKERYQANTKQN